MFVCQGHRVKVKVTAAKRIYERKLIHTLAGGPLSTKKQSCYTCFVSPANGVSCQSYLIVDSLDFLSSACSDPGPVVDISYGVYSVTLKASFFSEYLPS